jgi:hypothetical protein
MNSRQSRPRLELFRVSLGDLASLATAAGVVLVAVQLVFGRLQRRTSFEDDLAREYRELAARLPAPAFFDVEDPRRPLPPLDECLEHYVRYFDLSNQQVFLRMEGRVGKKTWGLWADGIRDNLERAGFRTAWEYIRRHSERSYNELASLYDHWSHDPATGHRRSRVDRQRRFADRPISPNLGPPMRAEARPMCARD